MLHSTRAIIIIAGVLFGLAISPAAAQKQRCRCSCTFTNNPQPTTIYGGCATTTESCACPASNCVKTLFDDGICSKPNYPDPTIADCGKDSPPPVKDGVYELQSEKTGDCLDLPSGSNSGADLQHNGCNHLGLQKWAFTRDPRDGCYEIKQGGDDRHCIDVASQSVNDTGGKVQWNGCNHLSNQSFQVIKLSPDSYQLVSKRNGLCIDLRSQDEGHPGGRIQTNICNAVTPNQRWKLQ